MMAGQGTHLRMRAVERLPSARHCHFCAYEPYSPGPGGKRDMADEMKGVLQALSSLIEMQKRFINTWESSAARFDRIDTETVKVNRQLLTLHEDQTAFRSDMTARADSLAKRMDAMAKRMIEFENLLDRNADETRSARTEIVGLENEILNAVQAGLSNVADANELRDRLEELERRVGL